MRSHASLFWLPTAYLALTANALPAPAPAPQATYSVVDVDGGDATSAAAAAAAAAATTVTEAEVSPSTIFRTAEETVSITVVPRPAPQETSSSLPSSVASKSDSVGDASSGGVTANAGPSTLVTLRPTTTTTCITTTIAGRLTTITTTTSIQPITTALSISVSTEILTALTIATPTDIDATTAISTDLATTTATATTTAVTTAATRSTSYYDNGMWHTSYAIPADPTYAYTWPASHYSQEAKLPAEVGAAAAGTGVVEGRAAAPVATGTAVEGEREEKKGWAVVSWNETKV